jgi:hypothetical protein
VAKAKGKTGTPLPRSLATRSAIRRELIQVYRATKTGELPPEMTGRLVHLLSVLASLTTVERLPTPAERAQQRRNEEISAALGEESDRLFARMVGVPLRR